MQVSGLFSSSVMSSTLKRNECRMVNMIFSFICVAVDKGTGFSKDGELMKVRSRFLELVGEFYRRRWTGQGNFNSL